MTQPRIFRATPRRYHFRATGGTGVAGIFMKDPAEQYPVGIDMTGHLPPGAAWSQGTVTATDLTTPPVDVTSTVLQTSAARISGNVVEIEVRAGLTAHQYELSFLIRDNRNHRWRERLIMRVRTAP